MSTSGTTTFSSNELDVYKDALGHIGVRALGQSIPAEYIVECRRKLNLIVKQWVSQIDFAPGLKMWTRRRGYLFLQADQIEYTLPGDPACDGEYVTTTLTGASPLSDTTLAVASITGISSADQIGIELDSGEIQWTTVNGAPSALTVTITTGLTGAAASGRRVFVYTDAIRKPFEILSASLRDTSGQDVPIDPHVGVHEYEQIPNKSVSGLPWRLYFEPQRTTAKVFIDCAPADTTQVIRLVYLSYIEDLTTNTGDVDFPPEWIRPLGAQLAVDLAPTFKKPVTPDLKMLRDESLAIARRGNPETSVAFFESDPDSY